MTLGQNCAWVEAVFDELERRGLPPHRLSCRQLETIASHMERGSSIGDAADAIRRAKP